MRPTDGRRRIVIEGVRPEIDAGRFPIKRVTGERVIVEADVFADGHDAIACILLHRAPGDAPSCWREVPMEPSGNDRWRAEFWVEAVGVHYYTIEGWLDHFLTWRRDLARRLTAPDQDLAPELEIGARLLEAAAGRAGGTDADFLRGQAAALRGPGDPVAQARRALDAQLEAAASRWPDRGLSVRYHRELRVQVERPRARFSTWYEMFPRSTAETPGRHGTLADCVKRLDYVAEMGFDVLYLPPIHPIGMSFRKGPNNSLTAGPDAVGSPWAIGAREGGHDEIHSALGTFEDFDRLIGAAREHGIEVALDLAFQCSPDHPWVKQHPKWFRHRPDGSIQYAENPPKKYQDIYPLDFEAEDWEALWWELRRVVLFWAARQVRIFRVDNPHTKAFAFWEWLIAEVRAEYPDSIFLAEAFTRPKVMYRLAKLGFSQSYTYFAWRNTSAELTAYFTELTETEVREYFRPNLWPNTPDILTELLQIGGRAAFQVRLILAATLGASYGIYGPAFELLEHQPREPGSEEYLDSEKYQLRHWDLESPHSLKPLITRLNRARRENPALQSNTGLHFHRVDNPMLLCYSKGDDDRSNTVLVVVNLDLEHRHAGWVTLDLEALGLAENQAFQVHDELSGARYLWQGATNYVDLDPSVMPAHLFRIRRKILTERDFDYYL
ncbi:MAG TPA: alpha-1,4-glucan--maltose-1-phosphate maltosyltransferase [Gemmatimonadales bacterium]|nr:alpha-1,4-glucan--maltose-1-phosphate maltosyltransferase [Gemmatimonadales bacterium]